MTSLRWRLQTRQQNANKNTELKAREQGPGGIATSYQDHYNVVSNLDLWKYESKVFKKDEMQMQMGLLPARTVLWEIEHPSVPSRAHARR